MSWRPAPAPSPSTALKFPALVAATYRAVAYRLVPYCCKAPRSHAIRFVLGQSFLAIVRNLAFIAPGTLARDAPSPRRLSPSSRASITHLHIRRRRRARPSRTFSSSFHRRSLSRDRLRGVALHTVLDASRRPSRAHGSLRAGSYFHAPRASLARRDARQSSKHRRRSVGIAGRASLAGAAWRAFLIPASSKPILIAVILRGFELDHFVLCADDSIATPSRYRFATSRRWRRRRRDVRDKRVARCDAGASASAREDARDQARARSRTKTDRASRDVARSAHRSRASPSAKPADALACDKG